MRFTTLIASGPRSLTWGCALVAVATLAPCGARADDSLVRFEGRWSVRIDAGGEIYRGEFVLESSVVDGAATLTGEYKTYGQKGRLTDWEISDKLLILTFNARMRGAPAEVVFAGQLVDGRFVGDVDISRGGGSRSYEFEATNLRNPTSEVNAPNRTQVVAKGEVATRSSPSSPGPARAEFRQGVDGYQGTLDTEIWEIAPSKALDRQGAMTTDGNNGGGESQVLMRFDGAFGSKPSQVPIGSRIVAAKLIVVVFDPGSTIHVHRVLAPWDAAATWNRLAEGIAVDGVEAHPRRDGFSFGEITMDKQLIEFDVTATVQEWAHGAPNYGWVFLSTGSNGWDFYSSDWLDLEARPMLQIDYEAPESMNVPARSSSQDSTER